MQIFGVTDRGCVREQNQDAFDARMLTPDTALAVVCDGMGGARAGNIASTMAVSQIVSAFQEQAPKGDPEAVHAALTGAAAQANKEIYHRSMSDPECRGMGTTVVAAWAAPDHAVLMNEGDSRAYHVRPDGIFLLTRDHSLVQQLLERGDITAEQARSHPQKNLITRALGVEPDLKADLYDLDWYQGESLLLCSDGLSNVLTEQELLYEVIHGGEPEDCCQRLLDIALRRGAPDNVTAVLIVNG